MRRISLLAALPAFSLAAAHLLAQEASPSGQHALVTGDALARYEWTRDIPNADGTIGKESRWRLQLRPRFEGTAGPFTLGLGVELNHSQDRNDRPPLGQDTLLLIRDNYRSRDARLDLAFGRVQLGPLAIEGGRFFMPLPITELLWDRDLRPQGGAASLRLGPERSANGLSLVGLYAKGSHVFDDESVLYGGSAEATFANDRGASLRVAGSLLRFTDLARLDPRLRRQNTLLDQALVHDYHVADFVVRLGANGPLMMTADYCWNTAIKTDNRGLRLSAVLGAFETTPARFEYVYSRIDRDATVAAFTSDDSYWATGWEGHRLDLGRAVGRRTSIHSIAQWQRPRDGGAGATQWVKRWRLEWRTNF